MKFELFQRIICLKMLTDDGRMDDRRQSHWCTILSVKSHINCIVACGLMNVVYLTACAFIRSL